MSSKSITQKKALHECVDLINVLCNMQINNIDSAIPFLRGAPGGGKTESIRNLAIKNGDEFLSCHFALKQPEDLGGIPQFHNISYNNQNVLATKWSIPEILSKLMELSQKAELKSIQSNKNHKVIFFLDDIHRCGPYHVTALFELLSERKIRDYYLPKNVALVLAGNDSVKAGAQLTNSAIINRCSIMDVYTDFNYWKNNFALNNNINLHILSFLENQNFSHFFHEDEDISSPWASPRSWTKLSNFLNQIFKINPNISIDDLDYICNAHIGNNASKEFIAYYQIVNNYNAKEIFNDINIQKQQMNLHQITDYIINKYLNSDNDELKRYGLIHALNIELKHEYDTQSSNTTNNIDNMCLILLANQKDKNNPFIELTISIIVDLKKMFSQKFDFVNFIYHYNECAAQLNIEDVSDLVSMILDDGNNND